MSTPESEESRKETRFTGHGGAVVRIGKEHAFLRGKPLRKNDHVSGRSSDGGDPRGMDQRKNKHFQKNSGVIRMTHVTKRASGNHAKLRRVHNLNIPVFTECADDPPANDIGGEEEDETRNRQP